MKNELEFSRHLHYRTS